MPEQTVTAEGRRRPAFYAGRTGTALGDWRTLLHPPYTAWHLSYVVIGSVLAPAPDLATLLASVGAFFLAVGIAAHCLDELHGRPLRTSIPSPVLVGAAALSLAGAAALGALGIAHVGFLLLPFIVVGAGLVVVYNLEVFGRWLHNDAVFSFGWGAFPVLTAYVAQARTLRPTAVVAAGAAYLFSYAQRALSTRARFVRRSVDELDGIVRTSDGTTRMIDTAFLIAPIEAALRALSWAIVAVAVALALDKMS